MEYLTRLQEIEDKQAGEAAARVAELYYRQRKEKERQRMLWENIFFSVVGLLLLALISWGAFKAGYDKAREETFGPKPEPVKQHNRRSS